MPFEVTREESAPAAIGRVASELAASALAHLDRIGEDPVGAVHEARRNIRSLRALVRLLRGALGEERYAPASAALRDAAHALSPRRDAHVVLGAFDTIAAKLPDELRGEADRLRAALARATDCAEPIDRQASAASARIGGFVESLGAWSAPPAGFEDAAAEGLRRCARRARRRYRDARAEPTPERLHELRKHCKDVREQLRILLPLKPGRFASLSATYDAACDRLGEERDLHLLGQTLATIPESEARRARAEVAEAARLRRVEMTVRGLREAHEATRSSPRELADIVRARWADASVG